MVSEASDLHIDLYNSYVKIEDDSRDTYYTFQSHISSSFATLMPITPQIFVIESLKVTHLYICVMCICTQVIWAIKFYTRAYFYYGHAH